MPSKAFSGVGSQLLRKNGLTYTALAEINSIDGPAKTRKVIAVTSIDSAGGYEEFIPGFRDAGSLKCSMNFTRDSYFLMNDDFESETVQDYRIVLGDVGATQFDFQGYVVSLGMTVPTDDKVTANVEIKITGVITPTS